MLQDSFFPGLMLAKIFCYSASCINCFVENFVELFVVLKVDDTEALPNYPYRDDALLIFEVIYDYVREVLEAFYGKQ